MLGKIRKGKSCLRNSKFGFWAAVLLIFLAGGIFLSGSAIHRFHLTWSLRNTAPRLAIADRDDLRHRFTIYRDEYGVPHIVGDTEEATFFGYGYAQAQDHLVRMMVQYRGAQGRGTEIEGYSALGGRFALGYGRPKKSREYRWGGDYLQRLLRTREAVVENRGKIEHYSILDAFARGVNAYVHEHRASVPDWIDGITADDVEALIRARYMWFYLINDALIKLNPGTSFDAFFGSNQFAIAPRKSSNGRVIHVENVHMPWSGSYQLYEAQLTTPGRLNAAGISFFGSPFFLCGFNDRITWSISWNQPNTSDVYEERLNPDNPREYLYEGSWRPVRVEREEFRVKAPLGGFVSVTLPVYYTEHGPIVEFDRSGNRAWSVKLANAEGVNYSAGLYDMMKAVDLSEFKSALSRQLVPRWNFLYSDSGNIYWVHNGNVPRRAPGYDWRKPIPGWTSKTEWGPYLPFDFYPQVLNPPSGWLQNCNNPPWVVTRDSGIKPLDPAPYYLMPEQPRPDAGEEALNTRGERIFQVLGQPGKVTIEDMKHLAWDTYVMPAEIIVPLLERGFQRRPDPALKPAMDSIAVWDRRFRKESVASTYMHFWAAAYGRLFPGKLDRFLGYDRRKIDIASGAEQDRALAALKVALENIRDRYGKTEVPWGEVNVLSRGGIFPLDGTAIFGVLHPETGPEQSDGRIYCDDGWGHVMVVMEGAEGAPKQVWSLLPFGESEDPASPHYNDQAKLHSRVRLKRFWFTPEEVLEHAESVLGDPKRLIGDAARGATSSSRLH